MSKFYKLRSADNAKAICFITKAMAWEMFRKKEGTFVQNSNVMLLAPSSPSLTADEPRLSEDGCRRNPTNKDFRGVSARPTAALSDRYIRARRDGKDADAVNIAEDWRRSSHPLPTQQQGGETNATKYLIEPQCGFDISVQGLMSDEDISVGCSGGLN